MSEIAARYVSVYPRIATGFSTEINAAVGKGVSGGGKALGVGMEKAAKDVAPKIATKFTSVLTPIFTGVGIMAVTRFVKSSVDSFNQFEDASDAAAVTFGSAMKKVDALAATSAKTLGMSKTATIEAATSFGVYANSAGLAGDSAADFSIELTRLGADMASFKGTSPERAIEAIGAALRGEMEPIRYFGVTLDDASLRARALKDGLIATTKEALTPQQKILAAHALILEKTTLMQGNFNDTAELGANVGKTLEATSGDLAVEIGGKLQPAIVKAQKAGIGLIDWAIQNEELLVPLAKAFGTAAAAVGGFVAVSKGIEALKAARATISGLGDAFQAMGTKAKIATASAGAVGIALTAGAAIYGVFAQRNAEAEARVEDFTAALEADTGALGQNTRAAVINALEKQGLLEQGRAMGIAEKDLTDAVMGSAEAMERVAASARAAEKDYGGSRQQQALATQDTQRFIAAIQGQNTELNEAVEANRRVTNAMGDTTEATEGNTTAAKDNADAQKSLADALWDAQAAQMAARGDHLALEASYDNASGAAKEYREELVKKYRAQGKGVEAAEKAASADIKAGKAVDSNTESGRKNREELYRIVDAARAQRESMEKAGDSAADVNSEMDRAESQFRKVAKQMGLAKDETEELVTELRQVKSKTVSVTVDLKKTGVSTIQAIPGKGHQLFTMKAYAGGGAITGGYPGRDSVPALLMPDEHVLTTEDVKNLGGHQGVLRMRSLAGKGLLRFASGGPVMPTYKGHSLDYWEDYLLTDLEYTRLQIQIKDLKADLAERETYYTGKGKKRKKRTRQKLRGLERTATTLELADAEEKLKLAKDAAKAYAGSGTIDERVERYSQAADLWKSAAESLTKSAGLSLDRVYTSHTNAMGDRWQTSRETTAADLAARIGEQATQVETFIGLLDQLRRAGASEALISDVMALGTIEGTKAARLYLSDRSSMAIAEQGYARLAAGAARLTAIGGEVGTAAVQVTINEAATPEATTQAVVAGILAGRS